MSDNEDGGLMLNLQLGGGSFKRKRGGKTPANRKKRIEKRRKLKNDKAKKMVAEGNAPQYPKKVFKQKPEEQKQMQKVEDDAPLQQTLARNKSTLGKNQKTSVKKTSIWGGNPDIPVIEINNAEKEDDTQVEEVQVTKFENLKLIKSNLRDYVVNKMGFVDMTVVQRQSMSPLLGGRDVLIRSPTGSGKTLAYSLALIQKLQAQKPEIKRDSGCFSLVLVPTRELALQTLSVFEKICLPVRRIVPTCLMGGQKRKSEKARLRKGVNIIISTPGRLLDHMTNTECLHFGKIQQIIFDEADRLLDLGFQPSIEKILTRVKEDRGEAAGKAQTVLLSATLTKGVESLVDLSLVNPVRVESDDHVNDKLTTVDPKTNLVIDKVSFPTKLEQFVVVVPSKLRLVSLVSLIQLRCLLDERTNKLVIFLSCRDSVQFHHRLFEDVVAPTMEWKSVKILSLHGGMEQHERSKAMKELKDYKKSCILLCTDVAARGLDIPAIDWVIQYTSAGNPVDYIHRVGRTARAGKQGKALLFLTPAETEYVKILSEFEIKVHQMKCDELLNGLVTLKSGSQALKDQLSREKAAEMHNKMEEEVKKNKKLNELSMQAFMSFVKSYATYPSSLKYIFHIKNLHLGHVAKSFALQEAPTMMLNSLKKCLGEKHIKSLKKNMNSKLHAKDDSSKRKGSHQSKADSVKEKSEIVEQGVKRYQAAKSYDPMNEFSSGMPAAKKRKL